MNKNKRRSAGDFAWRRDRERKKSNLHIVYPLFPLFFLFFLQVYLSRDEIGEEEAAMTLLDEVCVAPAEYYTLVAALAVTVICLVGSVLLSFFCFR